MPLELKVSLERLLFFYHTIPFPFVCKFNFHKSLIYELVVEAKLKLKLKFNSVVHLFNECLTKWLLEEKDFEILKMSRVLQWVMLALRLWNSNLWTTLIFINVQKSSKSKHKFKRVWHVFLLLASHVNKNTIKAFFNRTYQ